MDFVFVVNQGNYKIILRNIFIMTLFIKYAFNKLGYCIITPLEKNDTLNTSITNFPGYDNK